MKFMKASHSRFAAVAVIVASLLYLAVSLRGPRATVVEDSLRQKRAEGRRAIVISIDGLDVRYLRRADEFGLKIPTLRRLMREGVTAGVVGVYPSVTYPSHTTLVTGVAPARHGVVNNAVFEPPTAPRTRKWFWFAEQVKSDALWDAARRGGLKTALVSWPVATGAGDWNVPEIWKEGTSPGDDFPTTLAEISRHARPSGLVEEIAARHPDIYRNVTKDEGDDMRARWAEYLVREKRPDLVLVHLFDLDHFEHARGPFTPDAFAVLEKVDGYVGRILDAARQAGTLEETAVFIVSDHGFRTVSKQIQPAVVLKRAGLLKTKTERDASGKTREVVTDWRAYPYPGGGSCAILLRDANDRDALRRARAALEDFNAKSGGKLFRIVEASEAEKLGAYPGAAFVLEAAEGYHFGDAASGEAIIDGTARGMHGYLPTTADYRSTFVAAGLDAIRLDDLATLPMTEVAPLIAAHLGLTLRNAQGQE